MAGFRAEGILPSVRGQDARDSTPEAVSAGRIKPVASRYAWWHPP